MLLTKLNSAPVNFWRQGETMTSCYPHCYSTTCTSRDTMQCLSLAETWARDVPLPDLTWYRDSVTSYIHRNSLKKNSRHYDGNSVPRLTRWYNAKINRVRNNNSIDSMSFFTLLFRNGWTKILAAGLPLPQGGGGAGGHGQPQAGSPSTPGPGGGTAGSGASTLGAAGGGASGSGTAAAGGSGIGFSVTGSTGGGAGGGAAGGGASWSGGLPRRGRGWRDWRRGDPTLIKGLWKSKGPLGKGSVFLRQFDVSWMCIFFSFFKSFIFMLFGVEIGIGLF